MAKDVTEAERIYKETTGADVDSETALAIGLVWAVEQAGSLLDRVKVAKQALTLARAEERRATNVTPHHTREVERR